MSDTTSDELHELGHVDPSISRKVWGRKSKQAVFTPSLELDWRQNLLPLLFMTIVVALLVKAFLSLRHKMREKTKHVNALDVISEAIDSGSGESSKKQEYPLEAFEPNLAYGFPLGQVFHKIFDQLKIKARAGKLVEGDKDLVRNAASVMTYRAIFCIKHDRLMGTASAALNKTVMRKEFAPEVDQQAFLQARARTKTEWDDIQQCCAQMDQFWGPGRGNFILQTAMKTCQNDEKKETEKLAALDKRDEAERQQLLEDDTPSAQSSNSNPKSSSSGNSAVRQRTTEEVKAAREEAERAKATRELLEEAEREDKQKLRQKLQQQQNSRKKKKAKRT